MVIVYAYPSSLNRSAIRSEIGNTVELPAEIILPVTSRGSVSSKIVKIVLIECENMIYSEVFLLFLTNDLFR